MYPSTRLLSCIDCVLFWTKQPWGYISGSEHRINCNFHHSNMNLLGHVGVMNLNLNNLVCRTTYYLHKWATLVDMVTLMNFRWLCQRVTNSTPSSVVVGGSNCTTRIHLHIIGPNTRKPEHHEFLLTLALSGKFHISWDYPNFIWILYFGIFIKKDQDIRVIISSGYRTKVVFHKCQGIGENLSQWLWWKMEVRISFDPE